MENQPTKFDKIVKISIVLGVLIAALSVAYYFVIYIPHRDKLISEQKIQDQERQTRAEEEKIAEEKRLKEEEEEKKLEERALKAAREVYLYGYADSKAKEKEFIDIYGGGSNVQQGIINIKIRAMNDLDYLILIESTIERVKTAKNAPKIYTQQAGEPAYTSPFSSSINCTTHTLGSTTYTSCR